MAISRAVIEFHANVENAKKKIQDFGNRMKDAGQNIKKSFSSSVGGLVALGGGIKAIKDVYDHTKKLSDFSKTFSLPIEQVSKFGNVMSLFGASSDEALEDLKSVQQAIIDFKTTGSGALKNVSAQIGLSLTNADGSMKNSMQVIESLRQKFKGLSQSAQLKVAQELGLASPATLQMLRASDAEYAKMKKEASGMITVNESTSKKVQDLSRLIAKMKADWYGVGVVVLDFILPPLQKLAEMIKRFNGQSETTKKLIVGITGALMLIGPAVLVVGKLVSIMQVLATVMKVVWALTVSNPVGAIITGVVALGAAIYALVKNWDAVKEACSGAIDWMFEKIMGFGKFVEGIFDKISGPVKWVLDKMFGDREKEKEKEELNPIPTHAEVISQQNANTYNSNVANNNQTSSNNTKNVNNNVVIKVETEESARKIANGVMQGGSGVYN